MMTHVWFVVGIVVPLLLASANATTTTGKENDSGFFVNALAFYSAQNCYYFTTPVDLVDSADIYSFLANNTHRNTTFAIIADTFCENHGADADGFTALFYNVVLNNEVRFQCMNFAAGTAHKITKAADVCPAITAMLKKPYTVPTVIISLPYIPSHNTTKHL